MQNKDTILLTGASGLVGSAFKRRLEAAGFVNILAPSHAELDLKDDTAVSDYFELHKPAHVFLAAAKVGGILANETYPANFIYDNLKIQNTVLHQSFVHNVSKLLFLGSSCIYPKHCPQPMQEEALLSGKLEPTNEPYAIAKIAGIELCWAYNRQYRTRFLPVMPTNLFGPNDTFNLETSHALPALLRKFHEAHVSNQKAVSVWGTGLPRREFLHVDDLVVACLYLMQQDDAAIGYQDRPLLNIGSGEDTSIKELAELIKEIVGFQGSIVFDTAKPDGTPQKLLDISRVSRLGWRPRIPLKQGIRQTYEWYLKHKDHIKQ